jgi:calcyphosin
MQELFDYFDRNGDGRIIYDEFLLGVRGEMNANRKRLVAQAFKKLDKDGSGVVNIDDIKGVYNASKHPDVLQRKKTEDQVLQEFLETFEGYEDMKDLRDGQVTLEEFEDYYAFISCSIDDDKYFELMMNNAWRINEGASRGTEPKGWASQAEPSKGLQESYSSRRAPEPAQNRAQATSSSSYGNLVGRSHPTEKTSAAPPRRAAPQASGSSQSNSSAAMQKLRARLGLRGAKGFIGLQRQFRIMDDDNDKSLSFAEFSKACRDFRLDLTPEETKQAFHEFDVSGDGVISIDEFARGVAGEMSAPRRAIVERAFKKLDRDGDGVLRVNDIKQVYSARNHPDVRSGKRSEDEVLGEFLETFEMHHNLRSGSRDQSVTREEFYEYYNNVGANIQDDKYFEQMMITSFKLNEVSAAERQMGQSGAFGAKSRTTALAPFGTDSAPTDWSTSSRPTTGTNRRAGTGQEPPAGSPSWNESKALEAGAPVETYFENIRARIVARGARGIIGIARVFKIMDDDGSKRLSLPEFAKGLKDFRIEVPQSEIKRVYDAFDVNGDGTIDYDEFLQAVKGEMNGFRKQYVDMAFDKLDKSGDGVLQIDDVKGNSMTFF